MSGSKTNPLLVSGLRWLIRVVLLVFGLLVLAAITVTVILPRASSGAAMTVLTGSMTPEIPVGSVVLVRPVDPRTLEVGDIATYQVEPDKEVFITHRIIEIHDKNGKLSFTFKGDANKGPDLEKIPSDAVRGEVWFHVPYLGGIRDALHGKGGISLVAMILLAGYALTQISGGLRDRRSSRRGETASEPVSSFSVERTLVLAQLRTDQDTTPADHARQWGGLLLDSDDATYTLLIAPPDDGVAATVELLRSQQPLLIQVWEAPSTITGSVSASQPMPDQEESHVSA